MTGEEIENLKKGDRVVTEYTITKVLSDTIDAVDKENNRISFFKSTTGQLGISSIVKPAPTFEVGDTVRIIPDPLTGIAHGNGHDEPCWEKVVVKIIKSLRGGDYFVKTKDGEAAWISIHCLELVKKYVKDRYETRCHDNRISIMDNTKPTTGYVAIVATFSQAHHPNAEAAAKSECDRLNAEWRKSQEST